MRGVKDARRNILCVESNGRLHERKRYGVALRRIVIRHQRGVQCAIERGAVCELVGITECFAGMKPQEKLAAVTRYRATAPIGMVGDGVNDGPALAASDVGVAMGVQGTAMASQAAGVELRTFSSAPVSRPPILRRWHGWIKMRLVHLAWAAGKDDSIGRATGISCRTPGSSEA